MRLVTFAPAAGCERLGVLVADKVVDLALAGDAYVIETQDHIPGLPNDMMTFLNQGDPAVKAASKVEEWARSLLVKKGKVTAVSGDLIAYDLERVRLCAPVPKPPKIPCLALNYQAHADEGKIVMPEKPYVFIKPGTRPVVGPNDKVIRPPESQNFIFEGELAVVVGRSCRCVSKERAYEVVAGYTVVNDMSARDLGKTNIPGLIDWFQAKAFDTSLPMGPCLTLKDEIEDPHSLRLTVRVNGQIAQDASTGEMAFKGPEIIEFISDCITLDPGDIIATGTPGGSKEALNAGDRVEVEISNIGILPSVVVDREC
jgi:acylpyruvate hydrolase